MVLKLYLIVCHAFFVNFNNYCDNKLFCRDIIKDMKIDREKTFSDKSRADQVRSILQRKEFKSRVTSESRTKTRTMPFSARKTEQYVLHIIINNLQMRLIYC